MIYAVALFALIAGLTTGFLIALNRGRKAVDAERAAQDVLRTELDAARNRLESTRIELASVQTRLEAERQHAAEELQQRTTELQERAAIELAAAHTLLENERQHAAAELQQRTAEFQQRTTALKTEFSAMAAETLKRESEQLRTEHIHRLDGLLKPLGEHIVSFQKQFLENNASMDKYVQLLATETQRMGRETAELTKALRGDSKRQGDWGEAILERLLEISGLTRGREYFVQEQTTDCEGRPLRPDVIVRFPNERAVVIDSKVSLKDYADYANAESHHAAEECLKRHVISVRKHVKELSVKDYTDKVKDSIGYVLMFIPHEAAYVAAVSADNELITWAYQQRVIVLNPTNLLMALQLAYNLWQSEVRNKRVEEIYNSATKVYDKFVTFSTNFEKIGTATKRLQATYDDALKQLTSGRGNIISQLRKWKDSGMQTKTPLPQFLEEEETEAES